MPCTLPREVNVKERQTTRITGTLLEDDQVTPIPGSVLTTLKLSVYDNDVAKTMIVTDRDILNANDGTVEEDGQMVALLSPADVPILNNTLPFERHTCLFEWTWGVNPVKEGAEELILIVRNLHLVP